MKTKDIVGTGMVIIGSLFLYEIIDEMGLIERLKRSVLR